jgi:hypothetical protein
MPGITLVHELGHWFTGAFQGLAPEIISLTECSARALTPAFLLGGFVFESLVFLAMTQVSASIGRPLMVGVWFGCIARAIVSWQGSTDQAKLAVYGLDGVGWTIVIVLLLCFAIGGVAARVEKPIAGLEKGVPACS